MTLTIENVSENQAYNVNVTRLLDEGGAPIDPKQWQDKLELDDRMATLAPREKSQLCTLKDQALQERLMTHGGSLEISYFRRQGAVQTLVVSFLKASQLLIAT